MSDWSDGAGAAIGDFGAWAGARLGNAIDVYVDRTVRKPTEVVDPSVQYGIDANGRVYRAGQLSTPATAITSNPMMLMALAAGVVAVILLVRRG